MKTASALLKRGKLFIQGYSETKSGIWIASGSVYISDIANPGQMADQIRAAFASSKRGVLDPKGKEWALIQKPMLDAVGARNWTELAEGAKAVGMELNKDIVTFEPSKNYRDDGGQGVAAKAITVAIGSEQLGLRLLEAFDACE